jgi:L-serine deaminase
MTPFFRLMMPGFILINIFALKRAVRVFKYSIALSLSDVECVAVMGIVIAGQILKIVKIGEFQTDTPPRNLTSCRPCA